VTTPGDPLVGRCVRAIEPPSNLLALSSGNGNGNGKWSTGAIVGLVGGIVAAILVLFLFIWLASRDGARLGVRASPF